MEGVPPAEDPLCIAPVREPVPVVQSRIILPGGQPEQGGVEEIERGVGVEPLELEAREHDALVPAAGARLRLVLVDHADAPALVVELLQRVAVGVAERRTHHDGHPRRGVG